MTEFQAFVAASSVYLRHASHVPTFVTTSTPVGVSVRAAEFARELAAMGVQASTATLPGTIGDLVHLLRRGHPRDSHSSPSPTTTEPVESARSDHSRGAASQRAAEIVAANRRHRLREQIVGKPSKRVRVFWASPSKSKFHRPECPWAAQIGADLQTIFNVHTARELGCSPCKICRPLDDGPMPEIPDALLPPE